MRITPLDESSRSLIPAYMTAGLMAVAAATLTTSFVLHDLSLVTVSITGTVLAGVALVWTYLLSTSSDYAPIPTSSPAPPHNTDGPAGHGFPIEDYDNLRVDEICPLLQELDTPGLHMVHVHEGLGLARRAVIAHVEGLLKLHHVEADPRFPIDGYDQMRVVDILPLLRKLTAVELDLIATHELRAAGRRTILSRIARLQERQQRSW